MSIRLFICLSVCFLSCLSACLPDCLPTRQEKLNLHLPCYYAVRAGCSLLHWAAINNRHDIAELLINQGAIINIPGGMLGETPLLWAIRKKYYRMMQLLIVKGADLRVKSVQGLDGLHMAVRAGDWNMLFMLLHFGAGEKWCNFFCF